MAWRGGARAWDAGGKAVVVPMGEGLGVAQLRGHECGAHWVALRRAGDGRANVVPVAVLVGCVWKWLGGGRAGGTLMQCPLWCPLDAIWRG